MPLSNNKKVQEYLLDLQQTSEEKFQLTLTIRQCFFECNQALSEEIKYGGLVFTLSEELVGGIFSYKKHLSIEFSHGATFDDQHAVLEGKGKFRRHIKIFNHADIDDKKVSYYVSQAAQH